MNPILQMDLKVLHTHLAPRARGARATRRIQFTRTIHTPNPRQIHPLDALPTLPLRRRGAWHLGGSVDGAVAHHAFEAVLGVGGGERGEGCGEPGWGRWL